MNAVILKYHSRGRSREACRSFGTEQTARHYHAEMGGFLVDPAAFKAVVGRAERPGCVRFASISAIFLLWVVLASTIPEPLLETALLRCVTTYKDKRTQTLLALQPPFTQQH